MSDIGDLLTLARTKQHQQSSSNLVSFRRIPTKLRPHPPLSMKDKGPLNETSNLSCKSLCASVRRCPSVSIGVTARRSLLFLVA